MYDESEGLVFLISSSSLIIYAPPHPKKEQYDDHQKKKDLDGTAWVDQHSHQCNKNVSAKPNSGKGKMLTWWL